MAALIADSGCMCCCPEKQTENKLISWRTLTQITLAPPLILAPVFAIFPLSNLGRPFVRVLPLLASLLLSNKHHDDSEWTFSGLNPPHQNATQFNQLSQE